MLNRRGLLANSGIGLGVLALSACGMDFSNAGVTLATVRAYVDDTADVVSAAAQAYISSAGAKATDTVQQVLADLEQAKQFVDQAATPADAKSAVIEVITFVNQLLHVLMMAAPVLIPGPAAAAIPIALAVLQAFVNALPMPPNAPPSPPVALHRQAVMVRMHRH